MPKTKICAKCGERKTLAEFYLCGGELHIYCKECERARRRQRTIDGLIEKYGPEEGARRQEILHKKHALAPGMKVCARCGEVRSLEEFHRNKVLRDGRNSYCKACDATLTKEYHSRTPEDRLKMSLNTARGTARKKGLPFEITADQMASMWAAQDGRCFYTGVPMVFDGSNVPESVSIDRVDSAKGYTLDNVVLCGTYVNRMKNEFFINEFVHWCRLVVEHHGR